MTLERLYKTIEAAAYLGISASYLRGLRHGAYADPGPSWSKVTRAKSGWCKHVIYYSQTDLDAWVKTRVRKQPRKLWLSPTNQVSIDPVAGWVEFKEVLPKVDNNRANW